MIILALESSAKAASVAVCDDETLKAQYFHNAGLTHSVTLMKLAEDVLTSLKLTTADIDRIAVARGPGSFTGVRIGVSAAIGLGWGAEKPLCGVSTLEAMAYQVEDPFVVVCPVMDARRGQVYTATFRCTGAPPKRLSEDRAISIDELLAEAAQADKPYYFLGDGAGLCQSAFKAAGVKSILAPTLLRWQTAYGVARAAMTAEPVTASELEPVYLRVSQAERERQEREKDKKS